MATVSTSTLASIRDAHHQQKKPAVSILGQALPKKHTTTVVSTLSAPIGDVASATTDSTDAVLSTASVDLAKALDKPADAVRVIGIHEYKQAAACLADAFEHDHTTHYFLNTPDSTLTKEQKWDLHVSMMEYITYAHCMKGMVTTVGPNYDAVALWMPPGQSMDDYYTVLRSGMWRLSYKLTTEGRARFFNEFLPLLGESKTRVMGDRDTDSWYLVYIGTKSSARGKGYAKKLITHVTALADAAGKACYLESSNEVNPRIYGKYGFEIRKKVYLQRAEETVELDLMVREPVLGAEEKQDEVVVLKKKDSFLESEEEKVVELRKEVL